MAGGFSIVRAILRLGPDDPMPEPENPPEPPAPLPSPSPVTTEPVTDPAKLVEGEGWVVAHAYTPNEQATYGGGDHLKLNVPIRLGRITRPSGAALCQPQSRRFWGLYGVDRREGAVRCPRCLEMARRLGLKGEALDRGEAANAEMARRREERRQASSSG